jgi:hypothetical protein
MFCLGVNSDVSSLKNRGNVYKLPKNHCCRKDKIYYVFLCASECVRVSARGGECLCGRVLARV